ncbi:TM218 protein, partial [Eolophus roseicapillus]|nr:TM218 protein [Eolophus roseicapilla]
MAGAALGLGPGVLALQLLWALALVLCLVLSRAAGRARGAMWGNPTGFPPGAIFSGSTRLQDVACSLQAPVMCVVVLSFPHFPLQIVDTFLIGRFVLLAVMSLVLLGCLFLLLIYHLMEPVYAKPLPSS